MSMVYHWGWGGRRLEALQELLSHHAGEGGRQEVESVSELAGWHSYHGTNSPGTEETAAKLQGGEGRNRQRLGQCGACCSCPCPRPRLQTQTASEPACHQGHADGSLLGGCGCNTDLRAKSPPLCSSPHSYSHYSSANQHIHLSRKNILCLQWNITLGMAKTKLKEHTTSAF